MSSQKAIEAPRELRTIDDLKPANYNPRIISDKAATGLAKSLENFGDVAGITYNKRTGNIVSGHQRVDQLRKLGAVLHKGALQVGEDGPVFPIRIVDWSESKEKAANVSANNPGIGGHFTDSLDDLLSEIKLSLGDVEFENLQLDALLKKIDDQMEKEPLLSEKFMVLVTCKNETEQCELLEKFMGEGYDVRALNS